MTDKELAERYRMALEAINALEYVSVSDIKRLICVALETDKQ